MAQIAPPNIMSRLEPLAAALAKAAVEAAPEITLNDGGTADDLANAEAVTAVALAAAALLQAMPLTEIGVMLALGSVYGTALGNCTSDRRLLHGAFQRQCAATLAEVSAGNLAPMGNA